MLVGRRGARGPSGLSSPRVPRSASPPALLYAAGDVATKAAVSAARWPFFVLACSPRTGSRSSRSSSASSAGGALATAGTATLLTNALPIAAGLFLFNEHLPGGPLGAVRAAGFALVVSAAAVLARAEAPQPPVAARPRSSVAA